jgi:hypothetical protein
MVIKVTMQENKEELNSKWKKKKKRVKMLAIA